MGDEVPSRERVVQMVAERMYGGRVLNNAHRGEVVEMMVLAALGDGWDHVGLGWHPWDLERGRGADRVRLQVKQTAALQLWGSTRRRSLQFGWKARPAGWSEQGAAGADLEAEGWFCDGFVFGVHDEVDEAAVDQADPRQWRFMVVSTAELEPGTNSMSLARARQRWETVAWSELRAEVERRLG